MVARPSARERGVPAPSLAVLLPTRDAASGMKRHELIGTVEGREVIMVDPNPNPNPNPNSNPNPNPNPNCRPYVLTLTLTYIVV